MRLFIRRLLRIKAAPPVKSNLVFAFKDHEGRNYYTWPESGALPIERLGAIQDFTIRLTRSLTDDQLYLLIGRIDELITDGITKGRNAAKIAAITGEILYTRSKISSPELYLNYLAAYYVREDEDPYKYNQQVQSEKVDAFRHASNDDNSFFFALPQYIELVRLLNISKNQWHLIEQEWQKQKNKLDTLMSITSLKAP